jgi:hypothetical protein
MYLQTKPQKNEKKTYGSKFTRTQIIGGKTSGPIYGFTIVHALLVKGPTRLPYLFYLALVLLCFTLFIQPCLVLNINTISSITTILTFSNLNNSIHY